MGIKMKIISLLYLIYILSFVSLTNQSEKYTGHKYTCYATIVDDDWWPDNRDLPGTSKIHRLPYDLVNDVKKIDVTSKDVKPCTCRITLYSLPNLTGVETHIQLTSPPHKKKIFSLS